ncbi:putative Mob1/phocein family protein [Umbelopsis sp. PMI_123]|nr:putative Mob1/phocein family protein [Umbelopsis sp. PMI_123]
MRKKAIQMLSTDNLRTISQLPDGESEQEWVTVNLLEFFQHIMSLYATISSYCTPSTCPSMTAGPNYEFFWAQDGKKPIKVSAPHYTDLLRSWVIRSLQDDHLVPDHPGKYLPFDPYFMKKISPIYKRLFRIYAHIYHSHLDQIQGLDERLAFDISCKHFIVFSKEFSLIDQISLAPLSDLIASYAI